RRLAHAVHDPVQRGGHSHTHLADGKDGQWRAAGLPADRTRTRRGRPLQRGRGLRAGGGLRLRSPRGLAMSTRPEREDLPGRYAAALASRNPHALPLSPRVRFTENAQELALDEGLWATATACPPRQTRFVDPEGGEAGFMCVVREHDEPACVTMR